MASNIKLDEFNKYIKRNKINPRCYVCGKEIHSLELDKVEFIKNKRGSEYFIHRDCISNKNKSGV